MVVLVLTKDIVHRDEPLFFSSFLFFLFLGWDGSFLSSCLMVVGGCFWLRRVLLHSLSTYTLLIVPDPHHACLHVPPQKGMPFFFRKTPAQPHTHTQILILSISSLFLLPLSATLFYFSSPQMSTKIDSLGPSLLHCWWGGEIRKEVQATRTWSRKKEKKRTKKRKRENFVFSTTSSTRRRRLDDARNCHADMMSKNVV